VAVDIPSGLDADTGQVHQPCIRALKTVALAFKKRGLAQYPGLACAGEVVVKDIGIPAALADRAGVSVFELDERVFRERLGVDPDAGPDPAAHKGGRGHVLVAAGSRAMSGAGLLASAAALRGGCGLVTWAAPERVLPPLLAERPELLMARLADGGRGDWSGVAVDELLALARGKQALVIGPGMGRWPGDADWLRAVWERVDLPLVADADALNMMAAADFTAWPARRAPAVLTPHPGEMARLCGMSTAEVQRDRIGVARQFAMTRGVVLVLKGARTVCALPGGDVYVNPTGNAGMATAGSGDVLAGIIGALLAQGLSAAQAATLGVYRHGAAGDRAAAVRPAPHSLVAGDILAHL
jgi:NAD(P)H-hydrate epimerase